MSNVIPVLKIGPVLLVSIQIELRDSMAESLQDAILEKVAATKAGAVLIDISSLEIVDSFVARVISDTSQMVKIMDADVVVVGMQPAVTMTLVDMGMTMPNVQTAIDMESGLFKLGYSLEAVNAKPDYEAGSFDMGSIELSAIGMEEVDGVS